MSTALEVAGVTPEELVELQARQDEEYGSDSLQTPILKIGQPLTKEVQREDAEAGEFINTVLGTGIGNAIQFVIAHYGLGRFAADDDNKGYVAFGKDPLIPEAWADLVGEEWVGTRFSEFPDAEERYKARVNAKEIEWGGGPLVSTTHNFTGFAIVQPLEGEEGDPELQPARLSLKRTDVPTARKWLTLAKSKRNAALWDFVYDLSTFKKEFRKGTAHLLNAKLARPTTPDEKEFAVEIAQAVYAGKVADNSASDAVVDKAEEPAAEGAVPL